LAIADMLETRIRAEPAEVLRRVFGFPGFRGQQEAVVHHVLDGGDALAERASATRFPLCAWPVPR